MYYDINMIRKLLRDKPTKSDFLEEVHVQISKAGFPKEMEVYVSKGKYSHHVKKQVIQLLGYRVRGKKPQDSFKIYVPKG